MGSSFEEVEAPAEGNETPAGRERELRDCGSQQERPNGAPQVLKHRHFRWAVKYADVHRSVDESEPGNDGWTLKAGHIR